MYQILKMHGNLFIILQNEVAFGQIVRGMHHWGASLVIVMMFLHTLRVFFQGAYKKPRELNWIVGVLNFLYYACFRFNRLFITLGYESAICDKSWTLNCGISSINRPVLRTLIAGDATIVGAQTLTRFFAIHVFFLPAALFGLMAAHFLMIRKQGISGPL